jgi:hypothetical protein
LSWEVWSFFLGEGEPEGESDGERDGEKEGNRRFLVQREEKRGKVEHSWKGRREEVQISRCIFTGRVRLTTSSGSRPRHSGRSGLAGLGGPD